MEGLVWFGGLVVSGEWISSLVVWWCLCMGLVFIRWFCRICGELVVTVVGW